MRGLPIPGIYWRCGVCTVGTQVRKICCRCTYSTASRGYIPTEIDGMNPSWAGSAICSSVSIVVSLSVIYII